MDIEKKEKIVQELRNYRFLKIHRVPTKTFEMFKELADKLFCGDYGMLLKDMQDNYISDWKFEAISARLDSIENKLGQGSPFLKEIIMNDGKRIKFKKEVKKNE